MLCFRSSEQRSSNHRHVPSIGTLRTLGNGIIAQLPAVGRTCSSRATWVQESHSVTRLGVSHAPVTFAPLHGMSTMKTCASPSSGPLPPGNPFRPASERTLPVLRKTLRLAFPPSCSDYIVTLIALRALKSKKPNLGS